MKGEVLLCACCGHPMYLPGQSLPVAPRCPRCLSIYLVNDPERTVLAQIERYLAATG